MSKKKASEQPPASPPQEPDLLIEVEIKGIHVTKATKPGHWGLPTNVNVHVFDYYKGCPKDYLEPDDQKGELCRQTIYAGPSGAKTEEKQRIRVYIRDGEVFRVIMPPGSCVVVKTIKKEGVEPSVRRWVCKKKT